MSQVGHRWAASVVGVGMFFRWRPDIVAEQLSSATERIVKGSMIRETQRLCLGVVFTLDPKRLFTFLQISLAEVLPECHCKWFYNQALHFQLPES